MEAAFKGRPMSEFAPMWMNSQIAGLFDVSFAAAGGMETDTFSNILKIPLLLKTPGTIVDTLYWVDEVVRDQDNKAMALYQAIERAIEYIRNHPEVRDVLVSGGDPLMLSDEQLEWVFSKLREIKHVEVIRFGSRMPVVCPQRITPELCSVIPGDAGKASGVFCQGCLKAPR